MTRVVVESPFAGDVDRNIRYARSAIRHSLLRGEAPIASHLLYTQDKILDDKVPEERKMGMQAGWMWFGVADIVAFYIDRGVSSGMRQGLEVLKYHDTLIEVRSLLTSEVVRVSQHQWEHIQMNLADAIGRLRERPIDVRVWQSSFYELGLTPQEMPAEPSTTVRDLLDRDQ